MKEVALRQQIAETLSEIAGLNQQYRQALNNDEIFSVLKRLRELMRELSARLEHLEDKLADSPLK